MNKRAIVTDSRRPAKGAPAERDPAGTPHPLVGAQFVIGAAQAAQLPAAGVPEIAFAGRSNAGKSSAINALAGRTRLAFASRTPGRTQQINLFELRGGRALVADLPGYGYAAVAKSVKRGWQDFLWHYVNTRASLVGARARRRRAARTEGARHRGARRFRGLGAAGPDPRHQGGQARHDGAARSRRRRSRGSSHAAFPVGTPQVTVQLFSAATRQGVPEAETTIASWIPAVAWQNASEGGDTKERPRSQGE